MFTTEQLELIRKNPHAGIEIRHNVNMTEVVDTFTMIRINVFRPAPDWNNRIETGYLNASTWQTEKDIEQGMMMAERYMYMFSVASHLLNQFNAILPEWKHELAGGDPFRDAVNYKKSYDNLIHCWNDVDIVTNRCKELKNKIKKA